VPRDFQAFREADLARATIGPAEGPTHYGQLNEPDIFCVAES